jgi:acyl-CoA reductase-like NAD-dependent aldehyde dehydrogenase
MSGYRMLIGGALVAGGASLDVTNPATAAPFASGPRASKADADAAIAAAIAGRIKSGQVWVNQQVANGLHIPMAGFRKPGQGVEQSVEGLAEFARIQVINVAR